MDLRQLEQTLHYQWRPKHRLVVSFGPNLISTINWDHQGRVQDWLVNPWVNIDLTGRTQLAIGRGESFVLFRGRGFRAESNAFSFSTECLKWLAIYAFYEQGTNVNFFPTSGQMPFVANSEDGQLNLTFRPTFRIRFDQTYLYSRLATGKGSTPAGSPIQQPFLIITFSGQNLITNSTGSFHCGRISTTTLCSQTCRL